jgi:hypothetical protein
MRFEALFPASDGCSNAIGAQPALASAAAIARKSLLRLNQNAADLFGALLGAKTRSLCN